MTKTLALRLKSFWPFKDSQPVGLTDVEVANALRSENRELIRELYALTIALYNGENDRSKSIDGKAAALFGFVGAFVSAIFVVLGFLADSKNTKLAQILSGRILDVLVAVLIVLGLALMALFLSVVVKKGWKAPAESDVIGGVHIYDGHIENDQENANKSGHNYRRHLIEHFWKLYKVCFTQNEAKAKALFWGQVFVFIGLLLLVAVQVTAVLAFRSNIMSTPQNSGTPASATPAPSSTPVSSSDGRPPALPVSSKGTTMREGGGDRPVALQTSSEGQSRQYSEGRPAALPTSGAGRITNDSDTGKGK